MQFCKDCGGVLNLFGKDASELCSSCIQHKKAPEPPLPAPRQDNNDLLAESILTVENGKIILRSKEGWQLWSASGDSQTKLQSILKSAKLIYGIRQKRKKKP
jgi:hypothetical protein